MPKVSRKEAKEPLQEAVGPSAMEVEAGQEDQSGRTLPSKPAFAPLSAAEQGQKVEFRRVRVPGSNFVGACGSDVWRLQVPVPQHRMTPLKTHWLELYTPVTEHLKLDMRMNLKVRGLACLSVGL
jgi:RNA-binding protein PNO1